jgi:hypothetical protein
MRRETQNPLISSQILCRFAEQSSLANHQKIFQGVKVKLKAVMMKMDGQLNFKRHKFI